MCRLVNCPQFRGRGSIAIYIVLLLWLPHFTAAGSSREKDKQTPRENVETVSEQVQGVAQQQGVYTIVSLVVFPHILGVMVPTCAATVVSHFAKKRFSIMCIPGKT